MRPASRDYLDLQLRVASHYAALSGVGLNDAVTVCTNLRRRFGLEGAANEGMWHRFVSGLSPPSRLSENVAWAVEFQRICPLQPPPNSAFGCFSFEPPDSYCTVRIHFRDPNREPSASPLARSQVGRRRDELRAMFDHILRSHPLARTVRGASWLYNIEAYCKLFPEVYWRSAVPARGRLSLNGASTWGQVLDWRDQVKAGARDALLGRLNEMTQEEPWRAFPLQCLVPAAPIEAFFSSK